MKSALEWFVEVVVEFVLEVVEYTNPDLHHRNIVRSIQTETKMRQEQELQPVHK